MKIAVVGLRGFPNVLGGVETHCEQLYPRIASLGHEVFVFARRNFVKHNAPFDYQGCTVIPLRHFRKSTLEAGFHTFWAILQALTLRPDIIHVHAIGPALFVPLARLFGIRVIFTHHGMDYKRKKWGSLARLLLHFGEYFGVYASNRVIAISHEIEHHILNIRANAQVVRIVNGVNLPKVVGNQHDSAQFNRLGLQKRPYIFALGRFVPEKGFENLIEAWTKLPRGSCDLVIAGDADHASSYSDSLKAQAKSHGVILTGFAKGEFLHDLFRHAKLFVIPSSHEGLPIALLEAMSYNLQVVASDIEPHLEMELPSECYFSVGNVDALAEKLDETLKKSEHPAFRDRIAQQYNWDRIAEQTEKVYYDVSGLNPQVLTTSDSLQWP